MHSSKGNNFDETMTKVKKKNEYGILTIEIEKLADKPLGFYIRQDNGIFINDIKSEALNGLLCVNDEIISINEVVIKNQILDDVVKMMLSTTSLSLTVKRAISKPYDIVNGKVDQSYSHKLFNVNKSYDDHDVDETCTKITNFFKLNETCNSKKVNNLVTTNFTSEEYYKDWLSKRINKSSSNEELKLKNDPIDAIPSLPPFQNPKLLNKVSKYPSLSKKTAASSMKFFRHYKNLFLNSVEKKYIELPKPINSLTSKKQYHNSTIDEREFGHELNKQSSSNYSLPFEGYLNVSIHYSCIDKKFFNISDEQKFYTILRVDQQPTACTAVCLQNDAQLAQNYFMLDFNQQFFINLSSNKQFDFVICSQVKKKFDCIDSNTAAGDDEDDEELLSIENLFFSLKFNFEVFFSSLINKELNCKFCVHLKRFSNNEMGKQISFINISNDNNNNQDIDAYLYVTVSYLKEFSILNQIFSNKFNSKLIVTTQSDDKSCKFYLVLCKLINEIETRGGLYEPYLYQLNACISDIKWTLLQLERDCIDIIQSMPDIHVVSNVLKELLRELPKPVFNDKNLQEKLLVIYQTDNKPLLFEIVEFLPPANRDIFSLLMKHFKIVISYEKYNFMNSKKLANIFANLIFGSIELSLIKYNHEIFEFFLKNWETTASKFKISNNKNEHGNKHHRVHFKN